MSRHIPRFFIKECDGVFAQNDGEIRITSQQMHHAVNVLRLKQGDEVKIFNEKIGEWLCSLENIKKNLLRRRKLICNIPSANVIEIIACIPLINPAKMSIMLEKITELGVTAIVPVISQYTQRQKFNKEKAEQIIISACEQCGRIRVPKIFDAKKIKDFLDNYHYDFPLLIGDENLRFRKNRFERAEGGCAFLVGPEGGFSQEEHELFDSYNFVRKISLGENILRSETAAIAIAALVQLSAE